MLYKKDNLLSVPIYVIITYDSNKYQKNIMIYFYSINELFAI